MTTLHEIHTIDRFERVQDFASYSRLVKCAKESNGKRMGTSGAKIGNAHLKWAYSEAAVLFLRCNERGKKYVAKLEHMRPISYDCHFPRPCSHLSGGILTSMLPF